MTDSVGLGVQPRDPDSFRSQATERLVELFVEESIAFEVITGALAEDQLHGVTSPAGAPAVTFVVGRIGEADVRLGEDETGSAFVALAGGSGSLLGAPRRPGIVTVEDVVSTVMHLVGVEYGDPLQVDPPTNIVALRTRLDRDVGVGVGLTTATVVVGFSLLVLASLARGRAMQPLAGAFAGAALLVPAAYLLGLFIPSGSWFVRSIPVLLTPIAALLPRIRFGLATAGVAGLIGLLTVWAALNPGGEPALSLWGNPFESSVRFFGLRNHLEAFVAGSLILWLAIAKPAFRILVAIGLSAAIVIGAPWLGANFGGVLTTVFGIALVGALAYGWRLDIRTVVTASVLAVVGMVLALLSDTGAPISHGGRAVRSISADGLPAVLDILRNRARLNWREVTNLEAVGYLGAMVVVGVLIFLLVQGARSVAKAGSSRYGLAVFAGSAAALLALITEDSGFMTGGIMGLYPAVAWLLAPGATDAGGGLNAGTSVP